MKSREGAPATRGDHLTQGYHMMSIGYAKGKIIPVFSRHVIR